ncbi:uncharacterized protein LOC126381322 [Pectinophora gossypiella]|uniref:uncharacterized protein LOC126380945 n=1 Tax=Pectinophora gossypiella TaxID=13191 RepID=UPI00214E8F6D|nr:uncharacterized protein LOC126380945 [Pectinophora gossypiella]XP_049886482.1 uncharacterized protein LOC126380946 [Pectinophora gossypiella]XP_049886643.1 uncharacterized protein LOC126381162 [Pectinophora gossypiella]XP_049886778.1 uncharacterized protein LOC126381322 [Pectinophora gossypiella]
MRGPYKVVKTLPGGRYELKLLSGGRGKLTQAAAQHMVAWRGEWCPESCAAFFENDGVVDTEIALPNALPSMPLLDCDRETEQAAIAGPSSRTPLVNDQVEDDLSSGEAV